MHTIIRQGFKNFEHVRTLNPYLDKNASIEKVNQNLANLQNNQLRRMTCETTRERSQPRHLVCLKDWDINLINTVLCTAINLKQLCKQDSHGTKLHMLPHAKVMILEDHNEPVLRMAASKAVSLLGADEVQIVDRIRWDQYYYGKIFSEMADIILLLTETHGCVGRFVKHSSVPVMCLKSRRHASVQSMATFMSIIEDYGALKSLNLAYVGAPHQVLNDYLILSPMFGANFKFKCCCNKCPVSPLLLKDCKEMCRQLDTSVEQVSDTTKALWNAAVVIAGPTTKHKEKIPEFQVSAKDIQKLTNWKWTFYHTCPRGKEVDDHLFYHMNARTFNAFRNTQYIIGALLILSLKYPYYCPPDP